MEDNMKAVFDKWEGRFSAKNADKAGHNADTMVHKVIENGKQKWRDKFGDVRPRQVTSRRQEWKRFQAKMPSSNEVMLEHIASFKSMPTIQADEFRVTRPFMGQCCDCLPNSKHDGCDRTVSEMGLTNLLNTQKHVAKMGPLARQFGHLAYALQKRAFHKYTNVNLLVLYCPRVRNAIEQKTRSSNRSDSHTVSDLGVSSVNRLEKRALSILLNMSANISNALFTFTGWILSKFLPTVLSSLQVHNGQIHRLKQLEQRDIPVVYLPSHRSHLDYILVTYTLWNHGIRLPHIAAGENLNLPFFGWLIRRVGGFFIRRKLDQHGKRDVLYRALLHSYIVELLKEKESMELFLEGGRSRSGKSCKPKTGLLSVIVDACLDNTVEDVYIVPVSISYERLLDGNFIREQMGLSKVNETFFGVLRSFVGLLRDNYGSVRMDFSQPFSLREFIQVYSKQISTSAAALDPVQNAVEPVDAESSPPHSPSAGSLSSSSDSYASLSSITTLSLNHRLLVKHLAEHVCYDCSINSALMSTHLVAFLLMTKHRTPVTVPVLVQSLHWLKEQLSIQCRDVGYTGKSEDVIEHACALLGPGLVSIGKDENYNHPVIQANLSIPRVFQLSYYANAVTPVFILQSIMVNATLALSNIKLQVVRSGAQVTTAVISRDKILDTASDLCSLFRHEFIFVKPCKDLHTELADVLDDLVTSELISVQDDKVPGASNGYDAQRTCRIADSLALSDDDSDDDDDMYTSSYRHLKDEQRMQLNITRPDCVERIHFYQEILAPYVEAYWWTLTSLIAAGDKQVPEEDFLRRLQDQAIERVERGLVEHAEYCVMETLRNVLHSLLDIRLLDSFYAGNLKMIAVREQREASEKMREYAALLQKLAE